jgi:CRISPR type IV-associated protein Csf3
MTPLRVTARIYGGIIFPPWGSVELDGLLGFVRARLYELSADDLLDLPLQRSECGRVWLASSSVCTSIKTYTHHVIKRPVNDEKRRFNPGRRLDDKGGQHKAWMVPVEVRLLLENEIRWYCLGDDEEIRALLQYVTHLGRKRAHGFGQVVSWSVDSCDPWEGFPVVRHGKPLRPLPPDWPGLDSPRLARRTMTPPYWQWRRQEVCAVP